ncbi:MAG: DUF86 domain-containing protein [Candidatus Brocadiia bacterium]
MSRRDVLARLRHMLDSAREAVEMAAGKSRADLDNDRMLELALTHLVQIVGEAARWVPQEARDRHADIPWTAITGLRNRLVHGYDAVDLDILWEIVATDLPVLVEQLEQAVAREQRESAP